MQAWERCAGTHTPQASSPIQYGNPGTVFTSIIPSIIIVGYVTSNISRNVTSSSLRVARALRLGGEGLVAPPLHLSVTRSDQIIFQLPAPHPILISSLCSGPVCGRAWVSRLLPTSGHVAHGPVSSIDETRQPRVSSIARSRLGLPDQTRVTVTHTSAPSPISMRGAAPEVFASGTEREQTGS